MSQPQLISPASEQYIKEWLAWYNRRVAQITDNYIRAYYNGIALARGEARKGDDPGCSRDYRPDFAAETRLDKRP